MSRASRSSALRVEGASLEEELLLPRTVLVQLPAGESVTAAAADFERRGDVVYAEPNFVRRLYTTPNDPRFGELWGLHNTGQTVNGVTGTPDADIDAPEAWNTETGSPDVLVAVIDSGIAYDHPDLADHVWSNPGETGAGKETNDIDDDGNGLVDDDIGYDFKSGDNDPRDGNAHGTHVAGTIGAIGNNGTGVAGINWDVTIMPVQACGPTPFCSSAAIANSVFYAGDNGADIANMSLGGDEFSQAERDAIAAFPETLYVAAVGNESLDSDQVQQYPCNHPLDNIICVTASTQADGLAGFANVGAESVDLAAPGTNILSTFPAFATILFDDFEGAQNWDYVEGVGDDPAKWERTTEASASGSHSLTDSEGGTYLSNSNVPVTLSSPFSLDLPPEGPRPGGPAGTLGQARISGRTECRLEYMLRFVVESDADHLLVEAATSAAGPWTVLDDYDGQTIPPGVFGLGMSDLQPFEGEETVFVRFRLTSNFATNFDGAHVDDLRVICPTATYAGDEYGIIDGTSMAAPHVAGAAALLKAAEPAATPGRLKAAILSSIDPIPAFSETTFTGGRLNLTAALAAIDTTLEPLPSAQAATDATFGTDGKVTTSLGTTDDRALAVARQPDGKIVMVGRSGAGDAGKFAVVRYNADGSLDETFDGASGTGNGIVITQVGSAGADGDGVGDEARAVVIQGDGKIVVAGLADNAFDDPDPEASFNDFAVARYNADGTLDTTFGGDGKTFASLGQSEAWGVALTSDVPPKVVVVGENSPGATDPMVARFNANGTLDTSFDGDGKLLAEMVTDVGAGRHDEFHAVAIQGDGKIVAAGFAEVHPDVPFAQTDRDFGVVRLTSTGGFDPAFGGGDGIALTPLSTRPSQRNDEANAVLIEPDGKIVTAGVANMPHNSLLFTENATDDFAVARYNSDGSLDTAFSGDGKVVTSASPIFGANRASGLALQDDGKLVAAGVARDGTPISSSRELGLVRYDPTGKLDPSFNGDGKALTPIAVHPDDDTARGLALLPGGKIALGGYTDVDASFGTDFDFVLARVQADADGAPPAPPLLTDTDPDSPSVTDTTPMIRGSAEVGSTVLLYTTAACTGAPAATGSAASFLGPGLEVAVPADSTTTFRATAIDIVGNTSGCSTGSISYTHDSTPITAPILADTDPDSPANDNDPEVKGSAEAGSTVRLYTTADCTGSPVATGSAAAFSSPGLTVAVADNTTTIFRATATDGTGTSPCSPSSITYVEDSNAPASPTLTDTDPDSPANDNNPKVKGAAEAGSTVRLYATGDCTGPVASSGSALAFAAPGLTAAVGNDTSTTFRATATDAAGNASSCSASSITYVEDSTAPVAPTLTDTDPDSPANDNTPMVKGSAESGSTVRLYTAAGCTGSAAATGSAASFASPGLEVAVADNSTTTFRATATDPAGNTSACSASTIAYVEDSNIPGSWPMYGHDPAHSGNAPINAPSSLPEPAWTFDLNVAAFDNASPVVGPDGTIYVPSRLGFFAVNPNGTQKWKRWGADASDFTLTSMAPAVATNGTVYVVRDSPPSDPIWPDDALYALDPDDGSTLWRFVIGRGTYGSPTIGPDGTIYIGSAKSGANNVVFAINPNGTQKWQWNSGSSCWIESSPALGPTGEVYVNHNCLGLVALDSDGSLLWNRGDLGDAWNSPSVGPDGTVYIGDSSDFHAVDPDDGSTLWQVETENWMYSASAAVSADGSTVYRGDNGGVFYAFRSPGVIKWQFDTEIRGAISVAPALSQNGVVYFTQEWSTAVEAGEKGYVYALRAADGQLLWKREIGFSSHSPAVGADGTLYVLGDGASGDELHAFGCGADGSGNGVGDDCEEAIPPETTILSGPEGPTNDSTPTFSFSSSEAGSTFACRLDDPTGPFAPCSGPGNSHTTAALGDGTHFFEVRAIDPAGNQDSTPATRSFTVDTAAPVSSTAFPVNGQTYRSSVYAAGCANATADLCGSASDAGGTGVDRVEARIRRASNGQYWNGSSWQAGEAWSLAAGTTSWAYGFTPGEDTYTVTSRATDEAGNVEGTSSVTFTVDDTPPAAPTLADSDPDSPANDNSPEVKGAAEAGSTVRLYATAGCTGSPAATASAVVFGSPGITVAVADNSTTTYRATATDAAGNVSGCSASSLTYVEDSAAPAAPTPTDSDPDSPANDNSPEIKGIAEAGSTVRLYTTADCTGSATATGSAAVFAAPGLTASVSDNSTTTFKATATDAAGNLSGCSASALAYVEDSNAPGSPTLTDSDPDSPANDNSPEVKGAAEAGSTVRLYPTAGCTGPPAATGPAPTFSSPGLTVGVVDNTTTTFRATAADAAGNTSPCSASSLTYVEDSNAPAPPTLIGSDPDSPANDNRPLIRGTAEDGSTVRLYPSFDCSGLAAATGAAASFSAPGLEVTVANNSTTTFRATAGDAAGNTSACSASSLTYVEDSVAPAAPTLTDSDPDSPANDNSPELKGSAEAGSTIHLYTTSDCTGSPAATGSAAAFSSPGLSVAVADNTTTTFHATATDAAGNLSACSGSSLTYVEDSNAPAAPTLTDSDPDSPANDNTPLIKGSAEAGSTVRLYSTAGCAGGPAATGSATSFASPGLEVTVTDNSTTTFKATATDAAGNTSTCSTGSLSYAEDSSLPEDPTLTDSDPDSPANFNAPLIKGSAEADSTVRLYATPSCTGSPAATGSADAFLSPGLPVSVVDDSTTIFRATATDAVGNTSACSTSALIYTEDSTAPISSTGFPVNGTPYQSSAYAAGCADATPDVCGTASDTPGGSGVDRVEARIQRASNGQYWNGSSWQAGEAWNSAAGTTSWAYVLTPGEDTYTLTSRATDEAGNVEGTSSVTFTIDDTAPATSIDSGPAGLTNDATPTFTFSSSETGTFACRVDGAAFAACASPHTTSALADGAHDLQVRATDQAGNVGSPATRAIVVDTTAPDTTINSGPSGPTPDSTPTFFFFSSEGGGTLECRTDSNPFAPCVSPHTTPPLGDGPHSFQVRAADQAGNVDGSPASRAFTVDTTAPDTTIDSGPSGSTTDTTPTFSFSANEPASFQCRVDGGGFVGCGSPHTTSVLAVGAHTFDVRAIDALGNVEVAPASRPFVVAAPPPPPQPKPKVVKKYTICHNGRTKKVTKKQLQALRKKVAKAKKGAKPKLKMGACKKKPKKKARR